MVEGGYTKEELEETLRSIDPKKNPEDYAAIKAAISRALPAEVGRSCLDVNGLRQLKALVQPSTRSKIFAVLGAIALTLYVFWRYLLSRTITDPTVFWEHVVLVVGGSVAVWIAALWRTSVDSYRLTGGTIQCVRLGKIAWEESLESLVWVEEIQDRFGSSLDFHWASPGDFPRRLNVASDRASDAPGKARLGSLATDGAALTRRVDLELSDFEPYGFSAS